MAEIAFLNNDNLLQLKGLQKNSDGSYANTATVTANIKDAAGVLVTGAGSPLTLTYVAASNGVYQGTVPFAAAFADDTTYYAEITATQDALQGFWKLKFKACVRLED